MPFGLRLDRELNIALGAFVLLVLFCGGGAVASLVAWSDAADEAAERRAIVTRLEAAHRRARPSAGNAIEAAAPETAFLVAPTQGSASALLQAHVTRLVAMRRASVASSSTRPSARDDPADVVRLRTTFDMELSALQNMLYELETGTPYVFVDALVVSAPHGVRSASEQMLLHVTLDLRSLWRRTGT